MESFAKLLSQRFFRLAETRVSRTVQSNRLNRPEVSVFAVFFRLGSQGLVGLEPWVFSAPLGELFVMASGVVVVFRLDFSGVLLGRQPSGGCVDFGHGVPASSASRRCKTSIALVIWLISDSRPLRPAQSR
jgi:hypothetical protein